MAKPALASVKLTCWNPDVYPPTEDSFALVDAAAALSPGWAAHPPRIGLEIGSGSGYVVCSLALLLKQHGIAAQLYATEVNAAAALATRDTLRAHEVGNVDVIVADLVQPLQPQLHGMIDLLLFNPPYVLTPDEDVGTCDIVAAWAGGDRGRAVIDRLLPQLPALLSPWGEMLMVTIHDNGPDEIIEIMRGLGFEGRVALTRSADEELLHILHFKRQAQQAQQGQQQQGAQHQKQQQQQGAGGGPAQLQPAPQQLP